MIETVCKIPATGIEYFEYECKKCQNVVRFKQTIGLMYGCNICNNSFSKEEMAYLGIIKDLARLQAMDTSEIKFGFTFVSVEK